MKTFFEKNKVDISKLIWIPVGIDLNNFFHIKTDAEKKKIIRDLDLSHIINVDDSIILYVGFMDLKQKVLGMIDFLYGFKDFLNIISENQKKKLKLLYVGDGKYQYLLNNEINNLQLNDNVFLLGIRLEIEKFYAISDFGALTSYMEGFPIVLLEAVASKIPCICTDVGEVKEIVDENSIVPCGKREDITAKLKLFYENKDLCERVSELSFNKIKKYEWNNIAKQIKKIYKKSILESNIKKKYY
jgi:glycosyltransferase involved in cell wall biosynthesis